MRYNYPRPHRSSRVTRAHLYRALTSERAYIAGLLRQRSFLLNALEYMSKFISLLTGGKK